jgi:TPR repeat protein
MRQRRNTKKDLSYEAKDHIGPTKAKQKKNDDRRHDGASEEPETGTVVHRNASVLAESEESDELPGACGSREAATPSEVARIGLEKAVHHLKLAADQGDADAQYQCGISLRDGKGVQLNLPQAAFCSNRCCRTAGGWQRSSKGPEHSSAPFPVRGRRGCR